MAFDRLDLPTPRRARPPSGPEAGREGACPRCGGRGWIVEADGGAGTARPCLCRARRLGGERLRVAGIPDRYARCTLEGFHTAAPEARVRDQLVTARALSERYVDQFLKDDGSLRESGLLFVGPPGVGKTHLAVAVLREAMRRYGVRGRFVDFTSLVHDIMATFGRDAPGSEREILEPIQQADLLVLDELGAQKPTPWVQDILYLVINSRYTRRRPTVFTTNYRLEEEGSAPPARALRRFENLDRGRDDPEEAPPPAAGFDLLSRRVAPPLLSRLYEMAQPVVLDAVVDYRREFKRHQHQVDL